jgi:hypothetical protein
VRHRSPEQESAQSNERPRCEFVCVYQRLDRAPLTQACDRPGEFVMVTRCCNEPTVLCARHLLAAKDCEWAECLSCAQWFASWEDVAAALHRIS